MARHAQKPTKALFHLKGEGVFDVDGKRFPVSEGSIVRIAQWQTCLQEHRQRNARALCTI